MPNDCKMNSFLLNIYETLQKLFNFLVMIPDDQYFSQILYFKGVKIF